jgi:hypothetical protein
MKRNILRATGLACLICLFFLNACGLPGELKKEAEGKTDDISSARENVSKKKSEFLELKGSDRFEFFSAYAAREKWEDKFSEAETLLNQAENDVTKGRVAFLLKENKKDKANALRIELATIDRAIRKALQAAKAPDLRMAELVSIRDNAPQLVKAAETSSEGINSLIHDLEARFIPKSQEDHPNRADDILKRFEPLKKLQQQADASLLSARTQLGSHEAGDGADYAVLGKETDQVNKNYETLKQSDKEYRATISELYKSYTKILDDMRLDYYITLGRVSWDDYSDYWKEHNFVYPPSMVDQEVYEYFMKLSPESVPAVFSAAYGRGQVRVGVPVKYWNALKINPIRNWPSSSDNKAEFWIEDGFPKAYHKYIVVQENERKETGWVEIDEEEYFEYYNYLGMEIVSKPYGYFEDERIEEASPPGMSYVGNNRYGEWRTDHRTGRSFWYYYGIYSFLNRGPGYYYYRNDWRRWRTGYRNRKPYYGGSTSTGAIYGTNGRQVRSDSRYMNSDFARKGGLRTQTPSVRGAGLGRRGGGPGGRGK